LFDTNPLVDNAMNLPLVLLAVALVANVVVAFVTRPMRVVTTSFFRQNMFDPDSNVEAVIGTTPSDDHDSPVAENTNKELESGIFPDSMIGEAMLERLDEEELARERSTRIFDPTTLWTPHSSQF
jgi:hypothetical protein